MFFILFSDVTYSVGYKISRIPTNVMKRKQKYKQLLDVTIDQIQRLHQIIILSRIIFHILTAYLQKKSNGCNKRFPPRLREIYRILFLLPHLLLDQILWHK